MAELSSSIFTGRCGCGAVSFRIEGAPRWVAHCHCADCRAQTGSPFTTYAGTERAKFAWTGERPIAHRSSPGVVRSFCGRCGTPMLYEGERWPDELHVFVATLDRAGDLKPQAHAYFGQALPWIKPADGLPRYNTVSSEGPPLP